jgi:hypothetical protein
MVIIRDSIAVLNRRMSKSSIIEQLRMQQAPDPGRPPGEDRAGFRLSSKGYIFCS